MTLYAGPLGCDGVFLDPPLRHSPRLAAIAKVGREISQIVSVLPP